jgi:hypothetical protein
LGASVQPRRIEDDLAEIRGSSYRARSIDADLEAIRSERAPEPVARTTDDDLIGDPGSGMTFPRSTVATDRTPAAQPRKNAPVRTDRAPIGGRGTGATKIDIPHELDNTPVIGSAVRGLERGTGQLLETYGAASQTATGGKYGQRARDIGRTISEDAGARRVPRVKDIHGVRDALDYGAGVVGESAPWIGADIAAGRFAGPAGVYVAQGAMVTGMVREEMEALGIHDEDQIRKVTVLVGTPAAAAGAMLPNAVLRNIVGSAVRKRVQELGIAGAVKLATKSIVRHAATGAVGLAGQQTAIYAGTRLASGKPIDPNELYDVATSSAEMGATAGGIFGATGVPHEIGQQREMNRSYDADASALGLGVSVAAPKLHPDTPPEVAIAISRSANENAARLRQKEEGDRILQENIARAKERGWPLPHEQTVAQLGPDAFGISHEEVARDLFSTASDYHALRDYLDRDVDPKTEKPWGTSQAALARKARVESELADLRDRYHGTLGDYESHFGPEGLSQFLSKTELPANVEAGLPHPEQLARNAHLAEFETAENSLNTPAVSASGSSIAEVPAMEVRADPNRFQFKTGKDEKSGAGRALSDVETYNPDLAGIISVWKDPADGNTYVVNGHHRLELAKRTGHPSVLVRYLRAESAEEARAKGAIQNIAEGSGSPTDVAKFLRDSGQTLEDLKDSGVPVREGLAKKGGALANLTNDLFQRVATGQFDEAAAVGIGSVTADPDMQRTAAEVIRRSGKRLSENEAADVARQVVAAGAENVSQETLFGNETTQVPLFVEKAQLASAVQKRLEADKRLFGYVTKGSRADELARGGNTIDKEGSARLADEAGRLGEVFRQLFTRQGPVSDALTQGARRLANGEKVGDVAGSVYDGIRAEIAAAFSGRERAGEAGQPRADRGDAGTRGASEGDLEEAPPFVDENQDALLTPAPEFGGQISRAEMARRARAGETKRAVENITGEETLRTSRDRKQSEMFGADEVRADDNDLEESAQGSFFSPDPEARARDDVLYTGLKISGGEAAALRNILSADEIAAAEKRPADNQWETTEVRALLDRFARSDRTIDRSPEREALRNRLATEMYGDGAKVKERKALLIAGAPAAGKSWLADAHVKRGSLLIDPDIAKPELARADGENAVLPRHHMEASRISEAVIDHAIANGDDIVVPWTGRDVEQTRARIEKLSSAGYRVELNLVDVEGNEAARRAVSRTYREAARGEIPRLTEPAWAESVAKESAGTYDALKHSEGVAEYARIDNNGESPREIERGTNTAGDEGREDRVLERGDDRGLGEAGRAGRSGERDSEEVADEDLEGGELKGYEAPALAVTPAVNKARAKFGLPAAPEPPKALVDISRELADAAGVPLRQGRFLANLRKARGVFFPFAETTRVLRYDQTDVVAHEVGHFVSKRVLKNPANKGAAARGAFTLTKEMVTELRTMGRDLYGDRKPAGGYGEEGIAQAFRFYITEPERLEREAPNFARALETKLEHDEPDLWRALRQARADFAVHEKSPATARADALLSVGERTRNWPTADDVVSAAVDDLHQFRVAVDELGSTRDLTKHAYVLARLSRGDAGLSEEMLERGVIDFKTRERVTEGLHSILKSIPRENIQSFRRYLLAERALELWDRGIDVGMTKADALDIRKLYDGEFKAPAEKLWQISNALLKYRMDAGLLTESEYKLILSRNQRRVPMYVVFDDAKDASGKGGWGKKFARNSAGVWTIKGSARRKIDPLEGMIQDVYRTVEQANRHNVAVQLFRQALSTEGGGRVVEEVPAPKERNAVTVSRVLNQLLDLGLVDPDKMLRDSTGQLAVEGPDGKMLNLDGAMLEQWDDRRQPSSADSKDMVMPIVIDGERKWVQIQDPKLFDALNAVGRERLPQLLRVLGAPARTLRAGAVLTLEFLGRNPFRDVFTAAVRTRSTNPVDVIPGVLFAKGAYHLAKHDELYQTWRLEGGDNAAQLAVDRREIQKHIKQLVRNWNEVARDLVIHPIDTLRLVSAAAENATRLGEFAAVRSSRRKGGAEPRNADVAATLASRDVTVDFARAGSAARAINQIVAFFNANLQGTGNLLSDMRHRPKSVIPRALITLSLPSLILYAAQHDDEAYKSLPRWRKSLFWNYIDRDANGNVRHIFSFPKPFEYGILFGTGIEAIAEFWLDHDPDGFKEWARATSANLTPPVLPTGAVPLIENWANKNFYTGRKIVPTSMEKSEASQQATHHTGEFARQVGEAVDYSPAKIENLVRGWFGGLGAYGLSAANAISRKDRELTGKPPIKEPDPAADDVLTTIPGIKGFTSRLPAGIETKQVEDFYDAYERATALRQGLKSRDEAGREDEARAYYRAHQKEIDAVAPEDEGGGALREAYNAIADIRRDRRELLKDKSLSEKEKKAILKRMDEMMVEQANGALAAIK